MGNICDIFNNNNHDIYPNNYNNISIGIPIEDYNSNKNLNNDISYNLNTIPSQYYPNQNSPINPNQHVIVVNNHQPYYYNDHMIFAMEGFVSGVLVDELIGD